jgi:spore coat polysaccharide biosynthesis predicted glycosyltransferase SpsG
MNKLLKVFFRVDESPQTGRGHMSRCCALAQALLCEGVEISFYCQHVLLETKSKLERLGIKVVELSNESSFLNNDFTNVVIVVDGYQFEEDYWIRLNSLGAARTVCIDDFRKTSYLADIVVCYNEGVKAEQFDLAPSTRLFLGGRYLLLGPEILAAARLFECPSPRRVLMIASGGTSQEAWISDMLTHLSRIEPGATLWVLSGRRLSTGKVLHQAGLGRAQVRFFSGLEAKGMIRLYRQARCLVTPASTVMLEAFSAGCPLVSGWVADNQRNSLDSYERQGLIVNVGNLRQVPRLKLTMACAKATRESGRMARRQRAYIRDSKSGVNEIVHAILAAT